MNKKCNHNVFDKDNTLDYDDNSCYMHSDDANVKITCSNCENKYVVGCTGKYLNGKEL